MRRLGWPAEICVSPDFIQTQGNVKTPSRQWVLQPNHEEKALEYQLTMSLSHSSSRKAMTNSTAPKRGYSLNKTALVFQDKLEELEAYIRTFKVGQNCTPNMIKCRYR